MVARGWGAGRSSSVSGSGVSGRHSVTWWEGSLDTGVPAQVLSRRCANRMYAGRVAIASPESVSEALPDQQIRPVERRSRISAPQALTRTFRRRGPADDAAVPARVLHGAGIYHLRILITSEPACGPDENAPHADIRLRDRPNREGDGSGAFTSAARNADSETLHDIGLGPAPAQLPSRQTTARRQKLKAASHLATNVRVTSASPHGYLC